jgi:hypothetical protein
MDFHFAMANTEIVVPPSGQLETFGNTILRYALVSESMDQVDVCKVRSGTMRLMKPQIITPSNYSNMLLEGFGDEARRCAEWLQKHADDPDLHIMRYGYVLKNESFSEEEAHCGLAELLARVVKDAEKAADPFHAVVKGVDAPWDVCLVRLFWDVVRRSVRKNVLEMAQKHLFEKRDGLPFAVHKEIEEAFAAAENNPSLIKPLGALLQRRNVFAAYEERFFKLVKKP